MRFLGGTKTSMTHTRIGFRHWLGDLAPSCGMRFGTGHVREGQKYDKRRQE